jgi:hypothetical protein
MKSLKVWSISHIVIGLALILISIVGLCTSCTNVQLMDTTWKFDRAVISMQDGTVVSGKVDSWLDFENSDAVQIKIDGVTYYTHLSNVVLIDD